MPIPNYKVADCERCGSKQVPCRKRQKALLCISKCCRKDDTTKQLARVKVRGLISNPNKVTTEDSDSVLKEKWFRMIRIKLTGTCQCGCGNKSQKKDDMYFRHSCCHIFPKSKFLSVKYHPLNYVERAFWGGCHSVMDDTSIDRWVNMADFDDIKAKFYELSSVLTDEERATKFYSQLEKLIYKN